MSRRYICACGCKQKTYGKYKWGHDPARPHLAPLGLSLWEQIERRIVLEPINGCWLFTSVYGNGYGEIHINRVPKQAHRVVYEYLKGPILTGITLDHLCRVPCCVNPSHLEPVTKRENTRRGVGRVAKQMAQTHCVRGHEFDAKRTSQGQKFCTQCARIRAENYKAKKAAQQVA